jgi:ABC-type transport system involved in multi-copper enzyme maturation permease subunit
VSAAAPSKLASAARVFELSLGQMLWSRRSVFLAIVAAGPIALAVVIRIVSVAYRLGLPQVNGARVSGAALFGVMVWLLFIHFIVPVLGIFYGTALIADEVDDKTITYLFTRPIPRSSVLYGKYLAYLACTVLLLLPSLVIIYFLIVPLGGSIASIGRSFPMLVADLGTVALGVAAYGAVFALVGARIKRPLVVGLVFAFGWEPAVLLVPGYLSRLTVAYYLQALVPHAMPRDSAISALLQTLQDAPSLAVSLVCLAAIIGGALWWAGRAVEKREYVLEQ